MRAIVMPEEKCIICGRTQGQHGDLVHAFAPPGVPVRTSQFDRRRPKGDRRGNTPNTPAQTPVNITQTPFDPVLRQALLDKGILTLDDLENARRKIAAMTEYVLGGDDDRLQQPETPSE